MSGAFGSSSQLPYPHGPDNGIYFSRVRVNEMAAGNALRGSWPYFLQALQSLVSLADGDIVTDVVGLPGRKIQLSNLNGNSGRHAVDITGPWRTV